MTFIVGSRKRFSRLAGLMLWGLAFSGCGGKAPEPTPTPAARTPVVQPSAAATPVSEATPAGPSAMDRYLEQRKKDNQPKGRTDPLR